LEQITSFDVNKAIQRSLTKAVARHGLGLYIYAGEDLPETDITAGMASADPAPAEHPKASEPATVTVSGKPVWMTDEDVILLKKNAEYVYGAEWYSNYNRHLLRYSITDETKIPIGIGEMIKSEMKKDLNAKKKGSTAA